MTRIGIVKCIDRSLSDPCHPCSSVAQIHLSVFRHDDQRPTSASRRLSSNFAMTYPASPLYNADLAPTTIAQRKWSMLVHRGALDQHVGVHSDLHAGLRPDRSGDELEAGGAHDLSGQRDRADPDDSECACGARNMAFRFRSIAARVSARGARMCPRCCGRSSPADGLASKRGSAERRFTRWRVAGSLHDTTHRAGIASMHMPRSSASHAPQFGCFMLFWAINVAVIIAGINSIRILLNIKAPLLIALGLALLWLGLSTRPADWGRC